MRKHLNLGAVHEPETRRPVIDPNLGRVLCWSFERFLSCSEPEVGLPVAVCNDDLKA